MLKSVMEDITPELLLTAYANGYFPMAESRHDTELLWFNPDMRGIIPLDTFHVPRSLARDLKRQPFEIRVDTRFRQVITACAEAPRDKGNDSWISDRIVELYCALFDNGFAHCVEAWRNGELAGGLYGVSIGGAFFGESMFSHQTNASKAALVHLVQRLKTAGYTLLDTQFVNDHLLQFGVEEISKQDYLLRLAEALNTSPNPSMRFNTASPSTS